MIVGLGIDIAEIKRLDTSIERYGDRLLQRLFSPQEMAYCQNYRYPAQHFAGKFAVKEAFMKAVTTGWGPVAFRDIEVLNRHTGAPYLCAYGKALEITQQLGVTQIHVSVSHSAGVAVGLVILEQ